jgi:hypothetical protein
VKDLGGSRMGGQQKSCLDDLGSLTSMKTSEHLNIRPRVLDSNENIQEQTIGTGSACAPYMSVHAYAPFVVTLLRR